jgi:hypothetical protein
MNARLTSTRQPAHSDHTTSINGKTAPRKLCGIFAPAVLASGLLPRHQGDGTRQFSRIGRLRFTWRNKPKVRLGANKPGRLIAVVAAEVCLPISKGGGFGFDPFDSEQLRMIATNKTTLPPSVSVYLAEIQYELATLLAKVPSGTSLWKLLYSTHGTVSLTRAELAAHREGHGNAKL